MNHLVCLILVQLVFSSVVYASNDCRQTIQPNLVWQLGQELNTRLNKNSLKKSIPKDQQELLDKLTVKAINSLKNSWEHPNNQDLLNEAIADYVVVIDFNHSNKIQTSESRHQWVTETRKYILKTLSSNRNFQFELGLSPEEAILYSWAIMKPIAALTTSTRNRYDGFINASLTNVFLHDFGHYLTYLSRIQAMEPARYGNRAEFSPIEMAQFKIKQRKASLLILRVLEIIKDESLFPSDREKLIAKEVAFAGIHEGKTIVDPNEWISLSNEQKKFIEYVVVNAINRANKDHPLKSKPPKKSEILDVIEKISDAVKERHF